MYVLPMLLSFQGTTLNFRKRCEGYSMEITIANKIRIKNCLPEIQEQLIEILKVENPKYNEAVAKGRWVGNLKPFLYNFDILPDDSIRIPRGMRLPLLDMCDRVKADKTIIDERSHHGFGDINSASIVKLSSGSA